MAAGATYEPIATTTLGTSASSITFSSISSAYTDLRLVVFIKTSGNTNLQFNSDTGTNYSVTALLGDGSTASSANTTSKTSIWGQQSSLYSSGSLWTVDIFNYAGSTYKTCLMTTSADKNGSGSVERTVGLWRSTSAINSIFFNGGTYDAGTTATLYGILKA